MLKWIIFSVFIPLSVAFAEQSIDVPRISFSGDGETKVLSSVPGQFLFQGDVAKFFVVKSAEKLCGLQKGSFIQKFNQNLRELLQNEISPLLESLDPAWKDKVARQNLTVILDDFGADRFVNWSFYKADFPNNGEATIFLDCHPLTQTFYRSILAHELTHAVLYGRKIEMWFQESLAQLLETEAGGVRPAANVLKGLSESPVTPALLVDRVLKNSGEYAVTFLFGKLIFQKESHRGGWNLVKDFLAQEDLVNHERAGLLERLAKFIQTTPADLLRDFAESLILGPQASLSIRLKDWKGFVNFKEILSVKNLAGGAFILVKDDSVNMKINPLLEKINIMSIAQTKAVIILNATESELPVLINEK